MLTASVAKPVHCSDILVSICIIICLHKLQKLIKKHFSRDPNSPVAELPVKNPHVGQAYMHASGYKKHVSCPIMTRGLHHSPEEQSRFRRIYILLYDLSVSFNWNTFFHLDFLLHLQSELWKFYAQVMLSQNRL